MPARSSRLLLALSVVAALSGCATTGAESASTALADGATAQVAILETTDVHSNILSYDYYKQKEDTSLGYERVATLIRQARAEFPNSFLFDSGDTIQGTVLADFQAKVQRVKCDEELGIYKAFDAMGYDGGTAGNHEFNYGLGYLSQVSGTPMNVDGGTTEKCKGPNYPLVLSNVFSTRDDQPIFKPYTVVTRQITVTGADGKPQTVPLRVGIIGFTPPPIMAWDKQNLEGKVKVIGVMEAAQRYLPELEAQHPDIVVGILHGGLNAAPYTPDMENGGWHLAGLDGIDVLLLGHSHTEFPGPRYKDLPDTDATRGFVRGKPAVMGGFFGKDLGVIDLQLVRKDGRWVIDPATTHSEVRPICKAKGDCVPADPAIAPLVAQAHAAAQAYVNTAIGKSEMAFTSYFADEGNSSALAVVNAAQRDYVQRELPRLHPELAGVPVLTAASPFRTGFGGPDDYTDVPAGTLTLRSAADLYFYPNTLSAVKIDGAGVKAWLEQSAQRYNRIEPAKPGPQALINTHYVGYNVDQIQGGIAYVIDITRPAGQRITSLTYQGKPVQPAQPFIVVTNNYRASGGGDFPGLDGRNVVLAAPDGSREILAAWLKDKGTVTAKDIERTSWRFAPVKAAGPLTFACPAGKLDVAKAEKLPPIREVSQDGDGTALCAIDLSGRK
ncbi:bifunctional 2',3'-cyclic-nucleotide 2'-phosphodiesterase/3'-nucleotidase [Pseudoxanthomonas sp.]|uniref:bifunctional 2',3'-cyclic-nucleotide 2'-phosphodiesterase/3'-nucleotidase n=1 Tax=Pseudoxanthomonas sp. TaxID=1871049 RepID=UPI0026078210|nr:bifunctional 2',3'-cyclic-nucleotide 2'-phosphodiesterase/3'-nucleotidase [Pseudoxanthomonas sp.]WDS34938.1 MAG: bifunctional 2',3'-cyclic-nucleotide 2'-phosphodiesterase/3'-nucleotidase [Pseudoxanthomonas sp.]